MDAIECIKTRMSIRQFKPEPVPKEVLMEVIDVAKWSPSYKNSQPWELVILSGAKKEALTKMLIELLENGVTPCPDLPQPESWPAAEAGRIERLFKKRAEVTGIDMSDPSHQYSLGTRPGLNIFVAQYSSKRLTFVHKERKKS